MNDPAEGYGKGSGIPKKAERIEEFLGSMGTMGGSSDSDGGGLAAFDPCYLGYFECFNSQRYYEAHDVLEHLWLKEGREAADYRFYKGLIQLAGGFVHLKLQFTYPNHHKHGRRLHPARRLFLLSLDNLAHYAVGGGGVRHHGLDLEVPRSLAQEMVTFIEAGDFSVNPWNPEMAPILSLE